MNVLTTPSHLVRHLQLADLITGITTAMVCGQYDYSRSLFPFVKPLLITNNQSTIAGTGLKIHPDKELLNIYHWVLGETLFHRGGGARSFRMLDSHMSYANNELRK